MLKSSDFITHDLHPETVFEGCNISSRGDEDNQLPYELELILRKWYPMDRSREMRCFVLDGRLIGMLSMQT